MEMYSKGPQMTQAGVAGLISLLLREWGWDQGVAMNTGTMSDSCSPAQEAARRHGPRGSGGHALCSNDRLPRGR